MNSLKFLLYVGMLFGNLMYAMSDDLIIECGSDDFSSDDFSLDNFIDAFSRDTTEYSYSSGRDCQKVRIKDGVDLVQYVYEKRKKLLKESKVKDKKHHKNMFFERLVPHVSSEDDPYGNQTGNLVFNNQELVKIRPQALIDLWVQFDVREHIQRPGGVGFYTQFKKVLEYERKNNPQRYYSYAQEIIKKLFGKHSGVVRELKDQQAPPNISDVMEALANRLGSPRTQNTTNQIDMSYAFKLMQKQLQNNSVEVPNQITNLANMFGSLVINEKDQQQAIQSSQLQQQVQVWKTIPHDKIDETHHATQKVQQGTDTNLKATIIANVVSVLILAVFNYFTTGSVSGTTNTTV